MRKLNSENLSKLQKDVEVPPYDRSKVKAGILHVGIGGFHRAHQAFYLDRLLAKDDSHNEWGLCGVALLDVDRKIYDTLKAQDGLYTLVVKEADGSLSPHVIGSIVEYLFAPENPKAVIEKMAHPDIKIISLTITEGGYNFNEATGDFEMDKPLIQHDLKNPDAPKTIFGYLTQSLKLRKERGTKGCTIQSCDNVQENGNVARKMLLSYMQAAEPELVEWTKENVTFPNSMVDRITPVTDPKDIERLRTEFGVEDQWPVVCERFIQWVIEDNFAAGRPKWERVGAEFVEDVAPYEKMKLNLLNASHNVFGVLGALHGHTTIDQPVNDPVIRKFVRGFMDREATPTLDPLEGVDVTRYKDSLMERFENPHIQDQISRICLENSSKVPKFVLPILYEQLKSGGEIGHSAFFVAAWTKYNEGQTETGKPIPIVDEHKEFLKQKAMETAKGDTLAFINIDSIFGELPQNDRFVASYSKAYKSISERGISKALEEMNS